MPLKVERKCTNYKNCSDKFTCPSTDFTKQYCSIYLARLEQMEVLLMDRIKQKWGNKYPVCKLHKLSEEQYTKCIVIGTLFKDQKLKPSVLKRIAEGNQLVPQPILTHFTDESDVLFMEDEVQRYQLSGNIDIKKLVTGISCALLGKDEGKGKFKVDEFIFANMRDQIERPVLTESLYVLFLSGINFVEHEKIALHLQLLTYWISGLLGNTDLISRVCRVVIAGNSIRNKPPKAKPTISLVSRTTESPETIEAVKNFDSFLLKMCQVIDIDIMPGEHDPSNHILPQRPIHFCMFPESSLYKSFNQVSNPYFCEVEGIKIIGTSGQPINDILRYSDITSNLEAMESCLIWNHLAPTAPDTLGCFPFYNKDPFILTQCPHVLFAGNQEQFGTKFVTGEDGQKICLISIPDFSKTFQGVLLNLKDLSCKSISFQTN
ncbi:DNA polymerase delta small subunit isoform X2 [Sitophilus oryzae]|uniref:DNA polymerase delta small subunit isoform X2 n=1 Tax=Sitophilus oryzae TaxID=7048 RepID=A0A6J2XLP1_SITOR|nr:DNA polymerase delta small subunit isoform X2 [Sitophilus oryzae]